MTTALPARLLRGEGRDQRELGRELRRRAASPAARTSRSPSRSTTQATTFTYDSTTHVLTIAVANPAGAPDGPGALSHFDLARKDCLGTARNTTSKVWFTVANGVLSDVYYPTVDNTNVETLQYVVTDGSTFTDLQTRDMTYTVAPIDGTGGMGCAVTATAKSGKYSIVTDYITDPSRNTLLMQVGSKPNRARPLRRRGPQAEAAGLPALRPLRPDRERQRRRRLRQRRRRLGDGRHLDRPSGPRRLRHRRPRRTRPTATTRSRCTPRSTARFTQADERLRGRAERRARPARRLARAHADLHDARQRQRRPDRAGRAPAATARRVLALGFGASQAEAVGAAEGSLGDAVRQDARRLPEGLAATTTTR